LEATDLEELLEDDGVVAGKSSTRSGKVALALLSATALLGLSVVAVTKVQKLRNVSGLFVTLEEDAVPKVTTCFQEGMYYANPVKLLGTERTVELSAELCQQRCQVVPDCAHFTFWPDGGCLLSGEESSEKAVPYKFSSTLVGPKFCPDAIHAANAKIDEAAAEVDTVEAGSSGFLPPAAPAVPVTLPATLQAGSSKTVEEKIDAAADEITQMLPGVNGTGCSAYPACAAVGMTGQCCPNSAKVSLGCCDGFPKAVAEVKIAVGSECANFKGCAKLNMTGGCCPTPEGVQLGCCSEI